MQLESLTTTGTIEMARVLADAKKICEAMASEPVCRPKAYFGFRHTSPKFNFALPHNQEGTGILQRP